MEKRGLFTIMFVFCLFLTTGCFGEKKPDFAGYIFYKDAISKTTIVVECGEGKQHPAVLLRYGVSGLEIGSKVEVYYTSDAVNDKFPTEAPAKLKEMANSNRAEKKMLGQLFEYLYKEHGKNYYPSILNIMDNETYWSVKVNEITLRSKEVVTYKVSKEPFYVSIDK